ncbi:AraC family transcriptional regulator [Luteolibacter pohnpeiensis]|uniref:AraC family transcriptional regulator n=1 Tax=Luteolibacter pohnpeiensis TaxID=454153 RepID=A0A934S4R8_9BACT|nr:AraC family transcriptional regulator [Luteolibacter pohnpeiensis]MBK1881878.1 AraC family transcriptional regulator [Luteolibacter pohnpeiensis]
MKREAQPHTETIAAARQGQLVKLLDALAMEEGFSDSLLPGVRFMKSSRPSIRAQVSYEPSIVIIAQGRKCGYLGDKVFTYDANHFLVLSVPLPFECETLSSPEGPLLGISIGVNPSLVGSLMIEMETSPPIPMGRPEAIRANPLDDILYDTTVRLVQALANPEDARILGPMLVREMIFRVLRGEAGGPLRALAAPHSHFGQISRVLQRIHKDYSQPMDMATLAAEAGMSVSTFHSHFKAVTSSPPLQYLKNIRLHKARNLMVHEGHTAASAAVAVGYESAPQFSREFKRFFGRTPAAETDFLKTNLLRLV